MARNEAIQKLKTVLVGRRESLRKALQGDLSALRGWMLTSGDAAELAVESAHEEVSGQLAEVESRELEQIDQALARFKDGSYGGCEDCGKAIPLGRLQALPFATHCIQCQVEVEKSGFRGWSERTDQAYDSA